MQKYPFLQLKFLTFVKVKSIIFILHIQLYILFLFNIYDGSSNFGSLTMNTLFYINYEPGSEHGTDTIQLDSINPIRADV